jgi:alpha-tubulin suppressor-like RCC1 family protein
LSDGSVRATGANFSGNLGTGDTTQRNSFVSVYTPSSETTKCIAVSGGFGHTKILLSDGSVRVTGSNNVGQLGLQNGNYFKLTYLNINVTFISTGGSFIAVIKSDGSVWAKGYNNYGQVVTGDTTNVSVFTKVYDPTPSGGLICTAISSGSYHSHILLSDGSVRATGNNEYGQLGTGDRTHVTIFTKVYTPSAGVTCTSVSCGSNFTQLLLSDGSVWATGANYAGRLGTGDTTDVTIFTKVYTPSGGVTCRAVSCGSSHTQILLSDGSVRATGYNGYGQLGINTFTDQFSFVAMLNSDGTNMANVLLLPEMVAPPAPLHQIPAAPVIQNVTYYASSVNIHYTQILQQESGVTGFKYSTNNGQTYTSTNVTTSPLKISGLKSGIHHKIILKSNNGADSEPSNTYNFTYYSIVGKRE